MRPRITFLDDDHITRVARLAMCEVRPHEYIWLESLFSPEAFDVARLKEAARGVGEEDGCHIALASDAELAAGSRIVVFRRGRIDRALLDRNPDLQLVQRLGAATDGIDLAAAAARGVHVSCIPRRTLAYTAEHAIMLMLALRKKLMAANAAVRAGRFDPSRVRPIDNVAYNWAGLTDVRGMAGATVGIIGLGEVGRLAARLANAFGARVIYNSRSPLPVEQASRLGVEFQPISELLASADIVSLHAADIPENVEMIGSSEFALMRPDAVFINTSRGRLVDEDALCDALSNRRIAGAGLDVHGIEPRPATDRLCGLENVILTPHLAGGSRLGVLDELQLIFENCRAVLAGRRPLHGLL